MLENECLVLRFKIEEREQISNSMWIFPSDVVVLSDVIIEPKVCKNLLQNYMLFYACKKMPIE